MAELAPPPDAAARARICEALEETLFVEAGAGSGKTTTLVDRVVALVESGVELEHVAAITFTEKAAAELRDKIRLALHERSARTGASAQRCLHALGQVDRAAISTLHSFAQRILREHAVEAGLPPRIEVLDEVASSVAFEQRWRTFRTWMLEDDEVGDTVVIADACGIGLERLRHVASVFGANWDLVQERVPPAGPPDTAGLGRILDMLDEVAPLADSCSNGEDRLAARLGEIGKLTSQMRQAHDPGEALRLLSQAPSFSVRNVGNKRNWRGEDCASVRDRVLQVGQELDQWSGRIAKGCLEHLGAVIAEFTLNGASARRRDGRLEFHDLLVLARAMLRDPERGPDVRQALRRKYRHLLLDEFQDTDPIQIEIAVLIACGEPGDGALAWHEAEVDPGRLFFVGDPKQSIYRFRRADISLFLQARDRFACPPVRLTANFRSVRSVLDWVNGVFAHLIRYEEGSQPEYTALEAVRPDPPTGANVVVLGSDPHDPSLCAHDVRVLEAADVVSAIRTALEQRWLVDDGRGGWREPHLGDIAVLLPARTSLPVLEAALEASGIPYRTESSSLVYTTRMVRDLVSVARAVEDPTDELATVTALRSPMFGCGDDDLWRWKVGARGSWNHQAPMPESVPDDDPVRLGMEYLCELHRARHWLAPSEVLDRIVADRRLLEIGFAEGRPRDLWRRVRFVVDQARAWCDAEGGSLRGWLDWVGRQADEGGRVVEAVLPETDDDSVRIMTVHAAKGLQFPITIVSGLSTQPQSSRKGIDVRFPPGERVAYKTSQVVTDEYERSTPLDEQMQHHERLRLLYVACTRAQDHLVVSLHRRARKGPVQSTQQMTSAELMADALDSAPEGSFTALPAATVPDVRTGPVESSEPDPLPDFDTWAAELAGSLAAGSRQRTVAATALAPAAAAEDDPGLHKRPRDIDLAPWLKGRYGNAVGRAVHGVLQTVDLVDGAGLEAAAAAQAAAEGVIEHEATVERLARAALEAPSVQEAASRQFWRETYVAVPIGDMILEGYVDLLYRGSDGLVVVDYKTAGGADATEIDARLDHYRLQGGAYALAVAEAVGEPVVRCVFVFLTDSGPVERELDDLAAAVADARVAVAART